MPFYKSQGNTLHFLSDEDIANGGEDLLPAGCVPITENEAAQMLPKWSSDPILTQIREMREVVLNRLTGFGFDYLLAGDTANAQIIASAKASLLAVTTLTSVKTATNDAELIAALKAAYGAIVASVPLAVRTAFKDFRI